MRLTNICIIPILLCYFQFAQAAFLRCYNGSLDDYIETPLEKPLLIKSCINIELPTVFYIFGYRGRAAGPATTAMLTAYIANKKRNVILVDWEAEAQSGNLGIQLGYAFSAVPKANKIGRSLAKALVEYSKAGMDLRYVHLVGHSLGAHIMGFAGKQAREKGYLVSRITGLDPARALFEGSLKVQSGLDYTCAKFVDIIHTDPGEYGTSTSSGTVDIWPNYEEITKDGYQPGCPVGDFTMFSPEDLCSHDRSWRFFAEAIGSPTAFQASGATNYNEWVASNGLSNNTVYLGELTSPLAKGNYYLRTNIEPPFGLEARRQAT